MKSQFNKDDEVESKYYDNIEALQNGSDSIDKISDF